MSPKDIEINPQLDLVLERHVDVPVARVWSAWTVAENIKKWFVPRPWTIAQCEIDLRPGGAFRTVMRSPEGQLHDNAGCYLQIVPQELLRVDLGAGAGLSPGDLRAEQPRLALHRLRHAGGPQ